ncbi:MAG: hypothetical protein ACYC35_17780 [Pirellulales bacterium]
MKLFAGSLDVEAGTFLHAGYTSAYPRSFQRSWCYGLTTKAVDVKKALKLKEASEQTASVVATEVAAPGQPLTLGSLMAEGFAMATVFVFYVALVGVYHFRRRKSARPVWRPWIPTLASLVLLGGVCAWAVSAHRSYLAESVPSPWQRVPLKEYEDPEAATHAILQGLVVNALAGSPRGTTNLAAMQGEVAFPMAAEQYTPGMTYAQRTYGRDGWGRDFVVEAGDNDTCRIASAGPDGILGTRDDIVFVALQWRGDWECRLGGVFVRPPTEGTDKCLCLVHRVDDSLSRKAHGKEARQLTGNEVFDVFAIDELHRLSSDPSPALTQAMEQCKRQPPRGEASPLYFVPFTDWSHQ